MPRGRLFGLDHRVPPGDSHFFTLVLVLRFYPVLIPRNFLGLIPRFFTRPVPALDTRVDLPGDSGCWLYSFACAFFAFLACAFGLVA